MSDRHSFNYHEYYSRPRDHEAAFAVPMQYPDDPMMTVRISKVGSGTVGESYTGAWAYSVTCMVERLHGDDLRSNMPATHHDMARSLASHLSAAGESMALRGTSSEFWDEYTERERAFLIDAHERFSLFAMQGETFGRDDS